MQVIIYKKMLVELAFYTKDKDLLLEGEREKGGWNKLMKWLAVWLILTNSEAGKASQAEIFLCDLY